MDLPLNIKNLIARAQTEVAKVNPSWCPIVNSIKWEINSRMRRVLGRASMCKSRGIYSIELSESYVTQSNEESIYNTITHEIAHVIAFQAYNESGHGMWWKIVHSKLGGDSKRLAKKDEIGYTVKRNRIRRVVLEKDGKEVYAKVNKYFSGRYNYSSYKFLRTVIVNPDGSETPYNIFIKQVDGSVITLPVLKGLQAAQAT